LGVLYVEQADSEGGSLSSLWLKVPKVTEPEPPRGCRTVSALVQSSRRCASSVARLSGRSDGKVYACQGGSPKNIPSQDELAV